MQIAVRIGRTDLIRVVFAFVALFEVGHLLPDLPSAPGRLIIYGFRVQAAFLATAILVIAAVVLDIILAPNEMRHRTAMRSIGAAILAVICGGAVQLL